MDIYIDSRQTTAVWKSKAGEWYKVLWENICQLRILDLMKLSFRNNGQIKISSDQNKWAKLKGAYWSWLLLKKNIKEHFLNRKGKAWDAGKKRRIKKVETLWLIEKHIVWNNFKKTIIAIWYNVTELKYKMEGLPWRRSGWDSACQCGGHGFEPWSGRSPRAAERLGPWATITEPARLEPVLCNRRGHGSEGSAHRDGEWPPLAATREGPGTETRTQHSQK